MRETIKLLFLLRKWKNQDMNLGSTVVEFLCLTTRLFYIAIVYQLFMTKTVFLHDSIVAFLFSFTKHSLIIKIKYLRFIQDYCLIYSSQSNLWNQSTNVIVASSNESSQILFLLLCLSTVTSFPTKEQAARATLSILGNCCFYT